MASGDYGRPPHSFPQFDRRESGSFEDAELRGQNRESHGGGYQTGGQDGWQGPDRLRDQDWPRPSHGEDMHNFGPGNGAGMPHGSGQRGRGLPPFREGRGRGDFGRGFDFGRGRGDFMPRGRGDFGGRGRGWIDEGPMYSGRGRGYGDTMDRGEGMSRGRGSFRGRGDFGRGRGEFGRFGGRQGWEGRGRRPGYEDQPPQPEIDPALMERRRASNAALLKRQVSQLQVSKELLGDDESGKLYAKITESPGEQSRPDVRDLFSYPAFSIEEAPHVPGPLPPLAEELQAFEQCLQLYHEAQHGYTIVQSEHGNFLLPVGTT